MNENKLENGPQAANRHHARQTNPLRIRFVRTTKIVNGHRRHILTPTTDRDQPRILPDTSPYLGHGYVPRKPSAGILCDDDPRVNTILTYIEQKAAACAEYRGDVV